LSPESQTGAGPWWKRPRLLWVVLAALLLVSIIPIWMYHAQVLSLSAGKLADTEQQQQQEVTRSLTEELQLYQTSLRQQLLSLRQILSLTGLSANVADKAREQQMIALLENVANSNPNILFVTAIGREGRGPSSGMAASEKDPFIKRALERAFFVAQQNSESHSDPVAFGDDHIPAFVMAQPIYYGGQFSGMVAAVVSLEPMLQRLKAVSVRGRVVYVVDGEGRIAVHPDSRRLVPGQDISASVPIVAIYKAVPQEERRAASVTRNFVMTENGRSIPMVGTFSPVPQLSWAVISQRSLNDARRDAGVDELTGRAVRIVLAFGIIVVLVGYAFALGITRPIRGLAESTQAISRGEFKERAPVHGAAEISELALTFNKMADDIEAYIARLKDAAEENRELFIGSIRMLAAAIDEKDPYTRGHSGRVAKYSVTIGEMMGMSESDLDRLRISALLHDVGKIGVDDRILKKPGSLTPEEFELMKQHPVKGANIMRPVAQLREMLPGIELHHEHMDGKGYPYGLRGDQIPMMARIIAVADTLDAMTTNRPYQSAMDLHYALEKIRELSGTKFDADVVLALDSAIGSGRLRLSATLVEV
jgi:HD-GYP domain-containing protein (c-di-GMP phosphodiesterase class II)